jgi:hypothetical protein
MRKAFDWKRSRISVLEVEAGPQSSVPKVQIRLSFALYVSSLLLVESFGLRPKLHRNEARECHEERRVYLHASRNYPKSPESRPSSESENAFWFSHLVCSTDFK